MSYRSFVDSGDALTDKQIDLVITKMLKNYDQASREINGELAKAYAKYLAGIKPENYYNEMIKFDRLNKLLKQVNEQYSYYAKLAGKETADSSMLAFSNSYNMRFYELSWISPLAGIELSYSAYDPKLAELAVYGTADAWKAIKSTNVDKLLYQSQIGTLSDLLAKNRLGTLEKLQEVIIQQFVQQKSYKQSATAIRDLLGNAKYQADRIARTEAHRTANLGAYTAGKEAKKQGFELKKMWLATLDTHTRTAHARLDGQIKEYDEYFEIDGDKALIPGQFSQAKNNINCRCTIADVVNDQTPELRRGRNPITGKNEIFEFRTYSEWAKDNKIKL